MSLPEVGLLLLTGGEGRRFGAPKHAQPHPEGGSWAGHLVRVFEQVFAGGPIQVLGAPVPERPELDTVEDPREGPAIALATWARGEVPRARRWWIVACDQVRWTPQALLAWHAEALEVDPEADAWVLAEREGIPQYLGGFLGAALLGAVAASEARSLKALRSALPCRLRPAAGEEWRDVDRPEDLAT